MKFIRMGSEKEEDQGTAGGTSKEEDLKDGYLLHKPQQRHSG